MQTTTRVALEVETSLVYGRSILEGIARYLSTTRPWSIYMEQHELGHELQELLDRWSGDGIITRSLSRESAALLREQDLAVIDLSDIMPPGDFIRIQSADPVIGTMAANHLLERGFESLACCSFASEYWADRRRDAFATEVRKHGFEPAVYESSRGGKQTWHRDQQGIVDWLTSLPKPLGVFATNDVRGRHVLDACQRLDFAVPETVAVIGVDNDEVVCGFCQPPLTSIIPDAERIGYEAGVWLDRLIRGETQGPEVVEVPPKGIAVRQSSDVYAVSDPTVASALRFIREHACQGISVKNVMDHVSVSRSWLERQFRKHVDHSPQAEIRAVQVRRCKELLKSTSLSLDKIAHLTGFEHPEYMSVVFKRETKETPGRYRKRHAESE